MSTKIQFHNMNPLATIWKSLKLPKNLQLFLMRTLNDEFLVGVSGIFLDSQERVLLFRHTYRNKYEWGLPGGYVMAKEHPKEGLEREVKEETGLEVSADKRIKIRTDRTSARIDIVYSGRFIGGIFVPSKEVKEARLFEFDELPSLMKDQLLLIDKVLHSSQ